MFDSKPFDDLAKKLFDCLPTGMQQFEKELEEKFKETLHAAFTRLDLLTREEFDVQMKVLARTREKVEALEAQVADLMAEKKKKKK